jgi:hypothetical protein
VDEAAYAASLDRMLELDVDILCVGHNLVLTGKDARRHLRTSREQVPAYVRMVRRFLREEQEDIDRVATRVKAAEWDKKALPKQPEQAYMMNTKVRVRTILRHMKAAA